METRIARLAGGFEVSPVWVLDDNNSGQSPGLILGGHLGSRAVPLVGPTGLRPHLFVQQTHLTKSLSFASSANQVRSFWAFGLKPELVVNIPKVPLHLGLEFGSHWVPHRGPGGFYHSQKFLLCEPQERFCGGTNFFISYFKEAVNYSASKERGASNVLFGGGLLFSAQLDRL